MLSKHFGIKGKNNDDLPVFIETGVSEPRIIVISGNVVPEYKREREREREREL